MKHEKEKM